MSDVFGILLMFLTNMLLLPSHVHSPTLKTVTVSYSI